MASFDPGPRGGGAMDDTHWSVILTAQAGDTQEVRRALEILFGTYWYPVYAFIRHQGRSVHDAEDLTQAFFARLLAKDDLATLDPAKGKFRSWLLRACANFLKNEYKKSRAQARRPKGGWLSPDFQGAEARYVREPAHRQAPEDVFTKDWATALLECVFDRLDREVEGDVEKKRLLDRLKPILMDDPDAPSYAELGAELGKTEGAVRVAALRARKRYKALIREEIERTGDDPDEVDQAIADLFRAFRV